MNQAQSGTGRFAAQRCERAAELATGFALGDLGETELQELLELLRGPDGAEAAQSAWEVIAATTDLRAGMSQTFQDAVRLRLQESKTGRWRRAFRARLGLDRPRLTPVALPEGRGRAWPVWPFLAGALALIIAVVLWWRIAAAPLARVEGLLGQAAVGGLPLTVGDAIDGRPVVVAAGARLDAGLGGGGRVALLGPAQAVFHRGGLSLVGGRAWLMAGDEVALGLPDRSLRAAPGARLVVEVEDGRSRLGLAAGGLRTIGSGAREVLPGVYLGADGAQRPWRQAAGLPAALQALPQLQPGDEVLLRATIAWREPGDRLVLDLKAGTQRAQLAFRPGVLRLPDGAETALPGAPLAPIAIELASGLRGWSLRIEGRLAASGAGPLVPTALTGSPAGIVEPCSLRTGPARMPDLGPPLWGGAEGP